MRLSAAQKVVGSLPPAPSRSGPYFVRVQRSDQTVCNASRITSQKRKGGKLLPLLKAPSKQPKTTTLQVRLEEEVRHNLDRYAEFIGANASYVVSEALKFLFKRDDEFKRWLGEHPNNINQSTPEETFLQRPHNKHETPSNQIRCAREYSVLKTAAPRSATRSLRINPRGRHGLAEEVHVSASSSQASSASSPNNAAHIAATEGGRHEKHLLTVHEVANLLQVPVSWVYGRTRKRSLERIPSYRLGKYWRFRQDEVLRGSSPNGETRMLLDMRTTLNATQNKLDGPSMEERWLEEVSSKDRFSSAALEESLGWHAGGRT